MAGATLATDRAAMHTPPFLSARPMTLLEVGRYDHRARRFNGMTPTANVDRPPRKPPGWHSPANVNAHVRKWVDECVELCQPDRIVWCTGSKSERDDFFEKGVADGTFIRLNQEKLPGCYLHRSHTNDVARSEHQTFICTPSADMAGPTNNWMETKAAYAKLRTLFEGCMKGRTMYIVPFVMGPIGSPRA